LDIEPAFRTVAPLLVRPSSFSSGGFANLAFKGTNLELDGVDITMSGSIGVEGSLINRNGTSSRLAAPHISIGSLVANAASTLAGPLALKASRVAASRAPIRGYAQTNTKPTDLRLGGAANPPSRLDVDGDLVIAAGQVYPMTQTTATISAGNSITILPN